MNSEDDASDKEDEPGCFAILGALLAGFGPIYAAAAIIAHAVDYSTRNWPSWAIGIYFFIFPVFWMFLTELSGAIIGSSLRHSGKARSEEWIERRKQALGDTAGIIFLAVLEMAYFSTPGAAFASAFLAYILSKIITPLAKRTIPFLNQSITKE